eukprot:TRINITY_DN536_c0_g1_i3.p1 TRINITY_DN536_c0_g1~~TRINITY_DN536_c0_g1_i3.p1  ORF type:complete len:523 (-),score=88.32 TRINITY_DN536_c0_g1_i3:25-1539(-)
MGRMEHILVPCFALLCVLSFASADTPASCMYDQIVGTWYFNLTAQTSSSADPACLHAGPVPTTTALEVTLQEPDVALLSDGTKGFWTLIYNQGFEVVIGGNKYFAFFNWTQVGTKVTSHCSLTNPMWYHEIPQAGTPPQRWGCMQGFKDPSAKQHVNEHDTLDFHVPHDVNAVVQDDHELAARINAKQSSWRAQGKTHFSGQRLVDVERRMGSPITGPVHKPPARLRKDKSDKVEVESVSSRSQGSNKFSIPASYDWRNVSGVDYVGPMRDQLTCGSCYTFSTTNMLGARIRVATNLTQTTILSPQDIVSCSNYSQGCAGGFAYLGNKFGQDFGIVTDQCMPYQSGIQPVGSVSCEQNRCTDPSKIHYVSSYKFVGGYYGATTEELMQMDILANGPLAVAYEVYPDFMQYHSGVYQHTGERGLNPFQITNHAVMIVGWGVDTEGSGLPYWIVMNSWGLSFGIENGYFWILRGQDECSIESMATSGIPYIAPEHRQEVDRNVIRK